MGIVFIIIGAILLAFFILSLYSILRISSEQSRIEEKMEEAYRKRLQEEKEKNQNKKS